MSLPSFSILFASFKVEDIVLLKKNIEHDSQDYATYKIMPASRKDKLIEEAAKGYDLILIDAGFATDFKGLWDEVEKANAVKAPVLILNLKSTESESLIRKGYADIIPGPSEFGMLMAKVKSLTGKQLTKSIPSFNSKTNAEIIASPVFKIESISDQEVTILSPTPMTVDGILRLHSNSFEWIQGSILARIVECNKTDHGYNVRLSFLNLDLETIRNLRKWIMKQYSVQKAS